MNKLHKAMIGMLIMVATSIGHADVLWSSVVYEPGNPAGGSYDNIVFTTAGEATTPERVLTIRGFANNHWITGLVPCEAAICNNGLFAWNNMFSATAPFVDLWGILFNVEGVANGLNLYWQDAAWHLYNYAGFPSGRNDNTVIFVNQRVGGTPRSVPVPTSLPLMAVAALALAGVLQVTGRKKKGQTPTPMIAA